MDFGASSLLLCSKLHPLEWWLEAKGVSSCTPMPVGRLFWPQGVAYCFGRLLFCALVCALLLCLCTTGMLALLVADSNRLWTSRVLAAVLLLAHGAARTSAQRPTYY